MSNTVELTPCKIQIMINEAENRLWHLNQALKKPCREQLFTPEEITSIEKIKEQLEARLDFLRNLKKSI